MLTNISFTDPQGTPFTDAVFMVCKSVHNGYANINTARAANDVSVRGEGISTNQSVLCSYYYWPTQSAYDNGKTPYLLANTVANPPTTDFDFNPAAPAIDADDLEAICLDHLTTEILPTLQG